jgi:hypothetical protein
VKAVHFMTEHLVLRKQDKTVSIMIYFTYS